MKECIMILGMHRSGTSVLSGLVSLQGFHLGLSQMPLREDNPKGFFENHAIYRFNQLILEDHGTSWDNYSFTIKQISPDNLLKYRTKAKKIIRNEFGVAKRIFIKDPRMCLMFPLWEPVLKGLGFNIKVIYAFRSPMEVALSLQSRNDIVLEKSLLMWSHHNFQAELNSRSYDRKIVHYAQDYSDLSTFFLNLSNFLNIKLTQQMRDAAQELYTPELKHHQVSLDNISDEIPHYLQQFISLLKSKQLNNTETLDKIFKDFYFSQSLFLYDDAYLRRLIETLEEKNNSLLKLQSETESDLKDSKSKFVELQQQSKKQLEERERKSESLLASSIKKVTNQLEKVKESAATQLEEAKERAATQLEEVKERAATQLEEVKERAATQLEKAKAKLEETKQKAANQLDKSTQKATSLIELTKKESNEAQKRSDTEINKLNKRITQINKDLSKAKQEVRDTHSKLRREVRKRELALKHSYHHLAIGNELFQTLLTSKQWKKKFARLLQDNHYFKFKSVLFHFASLKKKKFINDKVQIIESGLFSPFYYLTRYPKAWESQVDPLNFFNKHGWKEEQNPGPHFDTGYYLKENPDVARSGVNPLLHYIQKGKAEGRLAKPKNAVHKKTNYTQKVSSKNPQHAPKKSLIATAATVIYRGQTKGYIDTISSNTISGWLLSRAKNSIPVIKINGNPTTNISTNLPRSDTPDGITRNIGFNSQILSSINNQAKIELLLLSEKGIEPVAEKNIQTNALVVDKYADLENALQIANTLDAVAITVWEGAHNPIGRAKVLYDIVATQRPVIIFAYVFGDFGNALWEPLKNSGINVVLIPYTERYSYHSYIQEQKIKFDTVWICKHRFHSFELASIISKPTTACILDIDDNENVFASSKASEFKPYGNFCINKANYYLDRVKTRSVASISIKEIYGGELMRHARKSYTNSHKEEKIGFEKIAVFIGTIRPHKNITDLVNAVASFNRTSPEKIKLALGGDFNPPSLKQTLDTEDTIILDKVSSDDLFDTLSQFDIVITSFPDKRNENAEINKLQITSKIGDGLAVGLPVLTPASASVDDLHEVPGLFIFTKQNFNDQLIAAMNHREEIHLPEEFTLEYSYNVFEELEKRAKVESKGKNIFELEPLYQYGEKSAKYQKNIVLIWKQHDSGVYGRRIDHIARHYKKQHPDRKVTVIEAISETNLKNYDSSTTLFDNSTIILNDVLSQKIYHYSLGGVDYRLITYNDSSGWNSFGTKFNYFLSTEDIYPHNSVIILFPILNVFDVLINIIKEYKIIVDLVDNQVKWMKKPEVRLKGLKQYYDLITIADEVVANSPTNIQYFQDINFFNDLKPRFIPNWYTLPESFSFKRKMNENEINLIYSGNLNDRINWRLFKDICKALETHNGYLHIAGTTVRSPKEMQNLLKQPNCIYHGVINEKQLLRLLQHINFAVIPHVEDHISKFMDPIKLKMYKKLGITSLCSQLPGLPADDPMLIITESQDDFLKQLNGMLENPDKYTTIVSDDNEDDVIGNKYMTIINSIL